MQVFRAIAFTDSAAEEILRGMGYSPEKIAEMKKSNAIR